jgi:hypothetical protein
MPEIYIKDNRIHWRFLATDPPNHHHTNLGHCVVKANDQLFLGHPNLAEERLQETGMSLELASLLVTAARENNTKIVISYEVVFLPGAPLGINDHFRIVE